MTKDMVAEIVRKNIKEVIPELFEDEIDTSLSLKEMGANSIDRMDIIVMSMEDLQIKIPMLEFGEVKNIQGIINLLYEKKIMMR